MRCVVTMLLQPTTPIIIQITGAPTREPTVADILLEAIGLTGAFIIAALLAGLLVGGIFIWFKRFRPGNSFNGEANQRLDLDSPPR